MRRTLALAAVALAATAAFAPVTTASAWSCDIAQNCACNAVNYAARTATGENLLTCA